MQVATRSPTTPLASHEGCLRVLHQLGGEVAAAGPQGHRPAHGAAEKGNEGCLRVLHELGGEAAASLVAAGLKGSIDPPT